MVDKDKHWWKFELANMIGRVLKFAIVSAVAVLLYLNFDRQNKQLEVQGKQLGIQMQRLQAAAIDVETKLSRNQLVETSIKLKPNLQVRPFAAAGAARDGFRYVSCQLLLRNIGTTPVNVGEILVHVQHGHPAKELANQYLQRPEDRKFECTKLYSANATDVEWVEGETRTLELHYSLLPDQERTIPFDYIVADYWWPTWIRFRATLAPETEGTWESIVVEKLVDLGHLPYRPGQFEREGEYAVVRRTVQKETSSAVSGELVEDVPQIPSDAIEVRKVERKESAHPPVKQVYPEPTYAPPPQNPEPPA